jgi:hypothetical protein
MSHEPLYRPVLRDAFKTAWRGWRMWPVALFAGILLSGSVYDVLWRLLNAVSPQFSLTTVITAFWQSAASNWGGIGIGATLLGGLQALQFSALMLVLGGAVAGISVICQGALVFSFGARRGTPTLKEALAVGAKAFWPVAVLNILMLALLLTIRALVTVGVAMVWNMPSSLSMLAYIAAFVAFAVIAVAAAIIQVFALNAMILQGATLAQALARATEVVKRHWIISAETGLILFGISACAWVLTVAINTVVAIPAFLLLILSAILGSGMLLKTSLFVIVGIFVIVMLAVGGWLVSVQYAAWTMLYRRLGEGGALPKIHRLLRRLTHGYHVPGA